MSSELSSRMQTVRDAIRNLQEALDSLEAFLAKQRLPRKENGVVKFEDLAVKERVLLVTKEGGGKLCKREIARRVGISPPKLYVVLDQLAQEGKVVNPLRKDRPGGWGRSPKGWPYCTPKGETEARRIRECVLGRH